MEGAFLSSLLPPSRKAVQSFTQYMQSRKKRDTLGQKLFAMVIRSGSFLITMAIVLFFVIQALMNGQFTATSGSKKSTTVSQSTTLTTFSGLSLPVVGKNAVTLATINKQVVEGISKSAALSSFPDNTSSALPSALVTAQIQHLPAQQQSGKGGLLDSGDDPCANYTSLPDGGGRYISSYTTPCPQQENGDWFIGYPDGLLFSVDQHLTLQNTTVVALLTAMQLLAAAMLTPIIAFIGVRVLTGAATARFADALESVPRLVLAVAAVASCQPLIQAFLDLASGMMQWIMSISGTTQAGDVVTPAGSWVGIITGFVLIVVAFLILSYVAQIEFLGTSVGAYISIGVGVALSAVMLGVSLYFVLAFASMVLAAQLIMRMIMLDFYIIFSPVAVIAAGLPGRSGQGFAMSWIRGLGGLIFAQVAQVAVLVIGIAVMNAINPPTIDGPLIHDVVKLGIITLMCRVPSVFKSDGVNLAQQAGSVAGGIMNGHFTSVAS